MSNEKINITGLYFEITDKCNFNCVYCYNDSTAKKSDYLSVEAYKMFIESIKEYGLEEIALSGGEPTFHPRLPEILEINHSYGLYQTLITNGTGVTKDLLPKVMYKDIYFKFTVDGYDSPTNDLLRGKNSYKITSNAIKLLVANGFQDRIKVRCNLHLGNYKDMCLIASRLKDMGVSKIDFSLIFNLGRAINTEIIDRFKHADVVEEIEQNIAAIARDLNIIPIFDSVPTMSCPYEIPESPLTLRIDTQGNIYPCSLIVDSRFSLGNIHLTSAASLKSNILDFSAYTITRQSKMNECQSCVYKFACHGGCVGLSLANVGDPLAVDGSCSIRKSKVKQMLINKRKSA